MLMRESSSNIRRNHEKDKLDREKSTGLLKMLKVFQQGLGLEVDVKADVGAVTELP